MVPSHLLWLTLGTLFLNAGEGGGEPQAPPFLEGSSVERGERESTHSQGGRRKLISPVPPLKDLQAQRQILLSDHLILTPAGGCIASSSPTSRYQSWMPLASLPAPLPSPHISPLITV